MVVEALNKLVEDGHIDPGAVRHSPGTAGLGPVQDEFSRSRERRPHRPGQLRAAPGTLEMRIDTRQVTAENLRPEMLRALAVVADPAKSAEDRIPLEDFKSFRHSIAWEFNKLYWSHLSDWETHDRQRLPASPARRQVRRQPGRSRRRQRGRFLDSRCTTWTSASSFPPRSSFSKSASEPARDAACSSTSSAQLDQQRGTNYYPAPARADGRLLARNARHVPPRRQRTHPPLQLSGPRRAESPQDALLPAPQDPLHPLHQHVRQPAG